MTCCEFCQGDLNQPARVGCLSPVMHMIKGYTPSADEASEAFEDVGNPDIDAALATVTPEQIRAFVSALETEDKEPLHADGLLHKMQREPWWKVTGKRDTQLRRLRTLRDAAVANGIAVCSTNAGYSLGDADMVLKAARRARRFAKGADLRATRLERLAGKMAS